jgi:integrase
LSGTPGVPGPYHDLAQSKVGALAAERRAIAEALTGQPVARSEAPAMEAPSETIREHAETFVDTYKPESKASEKREKRRVLDSHLLPHFGEMTIEGLRQSDVDAFTRAELARGMAIKTVNNRLAVLSTLIKYVTGERSRLRFKLAGMAAEIQAVDPEDVDRLLAAADDDRLIAIVLLAAEAGLRVGEIRGLQWTDARNGQITVRRALDKMTGEAVAPKHNRARTVPLSPRLVEALAALPRRGLWVISECDGSSVAYDRVSEDVSALYVRAGVTRPPKPIHCLRHTFGTVMARKVPLPVLRTLMGHADIQTTLRYVDVGEADKRSAIATVFGDNPGRGVAATRQRDLAARGGRL